MRCSKKSPRLEDGWRPVAEDDSRDLDQSCEGELAGLESCGGLESSDESDDGRAYNLAMNDSEESDSSGASGGSFEESGLSDGEAGDMSSTFDAELGDSDYEQKSDDIDYSLSDS